MRSSFRSGAVAAVSITLAAAGVSTQQQPVPGAIRSSIVLVPIDVRVIDRDGNAVKDLIESDFTVLEDGRSQRIGHFATRAFEPAASDALPAAPAMRGGPGLEAAPAARRTFLIVLGRGRLQYPARGIDAVRDFISRQALPQDLIAVQAYGRVTDLTTGRSALLRLLDHYEREHERIEALLDHWFQGPWSFDLEASPGIEAKVAAFFEASGLPQVRRLPLLEIDGESAFEQRRREAHEARARLLTGRVPERDFVYEAAGRDDADKLLGAIEHLRYFEGEKHVIFVSEDGLIGGRAADAERLWSRAADARVAVSLVQTGGVETSWQKGPRGNAAPLFMGPSPTRLLANADARAIARETGGVASSFRYASETLDRLDRATRFQYLIGYYPSNTSWNGERRDIEVRVRRPGVTVLHRGSYAARQDLVPFDRRAFLTHARVAAALGYRVRLTDIGVTVTGAVTRRQDGGQRVRAIVTIDPATIAFEERGGRHIASLDVAVSAGSRQQRPVGETRKRVDLALEPETYARAMKDGVVFETTLDVTATPRHLKAIVYDYASDRLGSAVTQIRRD